MLHTGIAFLCVALTASPAATQNQNVKEENQIRLKDGDIKAHHLAFAAVTSAAIAPHAIGPNHLSPGAVHAEAIATDAVGSDQIQRAAVTTSEIADEAVHRSAIAAAAVGPQQIAEAAVLSSHIHPGAVHLDALSNKLQIGIEAVLLASLALALSAMALAGFAMQRASLMEKTNRELLAYIHSVEEHKLGRQSVGSVGSPPDMPMQRNRAHFADDVDAKSTGSPTSSFAQIGLELGSAPPHHGVRGSESSLLSKLSGSKNVNPYRRLADVDKTVITSSNGQDQLPPPPSILTRSESSMSAAALTANLANLASLAGDRRPVDVYNTDNTPSNNSFHHVQSQEHISNSRIAQRHRPTAQKQNSSGKGRHTSSGASSRQCRPIIGSSHSVLSSCGRHSYAKAEPEPRTPAAPPTEKSPPAAVSLPSRQ